MENAVSEEDYERAALYKMRIARLNEKIADASKTAAAGGRINLKLNDVARAVSTMTGVPLEQLQRSEASKLAKLENHLSRHIIGQSEAIQTVARAIRRSRAGIAAPHRPIGSFVFLGPTGVGKTELARVLAAEVFGSPKNLIKVDMSEFSQKHTASRLVGAPAGYVGYDDGGTLTEKIRRQPYSVVLFDEIEKAHADVFNLLLQILEDGHLTDGHNQAIDFSNTVIILTSNVGAEMMTRENVLGFQATTERDSQSLKKLHDENQSAAMRQLRQIMRPELLNRFDALITFDALSRQQVKQILELMIEDLNQRLAAKGISVLVSSPVKNRLMSTGYDPKFGARPLRRTLQNQLEHLIAEDMLAGRIKRGDSLRAKLRAEKIVLEKFKE
jgi:ATP-dependent Clp protease ATP-binding subunit ClpC